MYSIETTLGPIDLPQRPQTQSELLSVLLEQVLPAEGKQVMPATTIDIEFPEMLKPAVIEHLHGDAIRADGIATYDTRLPLAEDGLDEISSFLQLDQLHNEPLDSQALVKRLERQVADEGLDLAGDGVKLYHATNALSHAFVREFGWIDPDDLSWLASDHLGITDYVESDTGGIFMGLNPIALSGYVQFNGGMYGRGTELLAGLGVDLEDADVRRLLGTAVILEIDPRIFDAQIPLQAGERPKALYLRDHEISLPLSTEVIAPIMASDRPIAGSLAAPAKVVAAVRAAA